MIDAVVCNNCKRIMDIVTPAISLTNDYICGECKQVITIKEKTV